MEDQAPIRRLAAILAADVVGYSRLMESDEAGTLATLQARRRNVFDPLVTKHQGRIFKTTGDGTLVEFNSAVNAVHCALDLQQAMAAANRDESSKREIVLRIGVNLGDVIVEGEDLYGDGVNMAARLEALAMPGEVYVSGTVHDHVLGKLPLTFDDLGQHALKNIAKPVKVYSVQPKRTAKRVSQMAPMFPGKSSIAVLPFVNMSGDPEQEFFTDGLTEDIITDISNVPGFFVIARNSTFVYKGKPTDVRQIARELGVKYVLEGSARRSAQRLRINVQLVDAAEAGHIWAERFDREVTDIFAVQDEVTRRVVEAIAGKLGVGLIPERYRPSNLAAYDLCVRSRNRAAVSKAANDQALANLTKAIELDPNYCEAHWQLGNALIFSWLFWADPQVPNRANALLHAHRAVQLDPGDSGARSTLAYILLYERRWDESELQFDEALRLNPNNADALVDVADYYRMVGRPAQGLEAVAKAMRLNPHPPGWYYWTLGVAQIANGQYEEAVTTLRREETYQTGSRYQLAAALALLGKTGEAQAETKLFLAENPSWQISTWSNAQPFKDPSDANFLIEAFRLAGFPE